MHMCPMFVCPIKNSYCGFIVGSNLPSSSSHWFGLTCTNPVCVTANAQDNGTIKAGNYAPKNCYRAFFLVFSALVRYITVQNLNLPNTLYRPFLGFLEPLVFFFCGEVKKRKVMSKQCAKTWCE